MASESLKTAARTVACAFDSQHVRLLAQSNEAMNDLLLLHRLIDPLNAAYAAALDDKRFEAWPPFFTEDDQYKLQAREIFDRGLPLAQMALQSKGMMKDRVYGTMHIICHGPYDTRHTVSPAPSRLMVATLSRPRPATRYFVPNQAALRKSITSVALLTNSLKKAIPGNSGIAFACTTVS